MIKFKKAEYQDKECWEWDYKNIYIRYFSLDKENKHHCYVTVEYNDPEKDITFPYRYQSLFKRERAIRDAVKMFILIKTKTEDYKKIYNRIVEDEEELVFEGDE